MQTRQGMTSAFCGCSYLVCLQESCSIVCILPGILYILHRRSEIQPYKTATLEEARRMSKMGILEISKVTRYKKFLVYEIIL